MERAGDNAHGADDGRGVGTNRVENVYYQEPAVQCHDLDGEILRRVIDNDAGVAGLRIQEESPHLVPEEEWRRVGDAIANSRRLLKLQVESFADRGLLLGLARNRSIQHLSLWKLESEHFEHIPIDNPFVLLNCNLRCIDLAWCDLTHILSWFISSMSRCSQLERIELCHNNYGYGYSDSTRPVTVMPPSIIKSLFHQPNLLELKLGGRFDKSGYVDVAKLLSRSASNISSISFESSDLDDESFTILIDSFAKSKSIRKFHFDANGYDTITATGWHRFSALLQNPSCSLEKLLLEATAMDEAGATSLGNALSVNNTVKHVSLKCSSSIKSAGWRDFASCLSNPTSALEELDISKCEDDEYEEHDESNTALNDDAALAIAESLAMNSSLKKLNMSYNTITPEGWIAFFNTLIHSECYLEELDLKYDDISDEAAGAMVDLFASMSRLRTLHLQCNSFGTDGLREFTRLLQATSKVETLHLAGNHFDDDVVIEFANMLDNNTSLNTLSIGGREVTDRSWVALSRVVCDKSTIESTYLSNHTLNKIEKLDGRDLVREAIPDELASYLTLNKHPGKAAVARQKILAYHFPAESANIQVFDGMSVLMLPHAIEWIGRDGLGISLMYKVAQGIPSLVKSKILHVNGKMKNISLDT